MSVLDLTLDGIVRRAIRAVGYAVSAVSPDPGHPTLAGIHLTSRGGRLVIEGTDSYRLHVVTLRDIHAPADLDLVVPGKWLAEIARVRKEITPRVEFTRAEARATVGAEKRTIPLIEGVYPNTGPVLRSEASFPRVESGEFLGKVSFIADVAKALDLLGLTGRMRIDEGGVHPARITATGGAAEFEALVMPVRFVESR